MKKPKCIVEEHIPVNIFSRPAIVREHTVAIDLHWNGNAGMSEFALASYLRNLSNQRTDDHKTDRFAGANYCIGPSASIEIVPHNEVTYTAGADGMSRTYTPYAKEIFGEKFTRYWPDSRQYYNDSYYGLSPNFLTVSIEMVHPDHTGKFEPDTIKNTTETVTWLINKFYSNAYIVRHYDITGKACPKYWVNHPEEFEDFCSNIESYEH